MQRYGDSVGQNADDAGILARETFHRIRLDHLAYRVAVGDAPRIAVGGFKNPDELKVFAPYQAFVPVIIDADDDTRFTRGIRIGSVATEMGREVGASVTEDEFAREVDLEIAEVVRWQARLG